MAAPPPDTLIAALLAAVLGIFAPATGFVVTVLKPASTSTCSPAARNLVAPTTSAAPGADWQELAAKLSGELADSDDPEAQKLAQSIGDTGTTDTTGAPTTRTRTTAAPTRTAAPGPCPAPSDRTGPATRAPATRAPATRAPAARAPAARTSSPSSPSADERWEQLAGQLAAALTGSTDPRVADLQEALDRAGFPPARTTAAPEPDDPG